MPPRWTVAVLSVTGAAVLAACGSSGTSSSGSSTSPSAPAASAAGSKAAASGSSSGVPCAQIKPLRMSLTDLSQQKVSLTSAGRIATDLTRAEQELTALKSQGAGAFSAQANQLSAELTAIKTDASVLASSPSPGNLTKLTGAITTFKSTAQPLIREMQAVCP
jgi:hypothetical protein